MKKTGEIEKEIFKKAASIAKEVAAGKDIYISKSRDGVNIKSLNIRKID